MKLPNAPKDYDAHDQEQMRAALESAVSRLELHREPRRVLYQNGVLSTVSTSEVSLASVVIPGKTLAKAFQVLRVHMVGAPNTQIGTLILKYGATNLMSFAIAANSVATMECYFWRFGSNVQSRAEALKWEGIGAVTTTETNTGTVTDDTDSDQTLDFRALVVSGGTMVMRFASVEFLGVDTLDL